MINEKPRVRFAPSPTGYLHVGGLRTALYNYLFAKHNDGKFILRIEDTDRNRYVEGAVENLIKVLKWAGLDYDEGPDIGGDLGPYMQSQRLEIYKTHADELISRGKAYYCFCTPERLTALREEQEKQKLPQAKYDKHCLALPKNDIEKKLSENVQYVIRLNVEPSQKIIFDDVIRDRVEFDSNNVDDQVLIKSDGFPTYHLANVVDDHLMKITHVIRGEEWLSSTPKHVLLYDAFGWERPIFAHLPLLLNPDRSKLSKRQGDVAVEDYRDKGYLREALINFVALLGWNAGDDREFYYLNELVEAFSLNRVNKAGAVFDVVKLNSLNAEHLRRKSDSELSDLFVEYPKRTTNLELYTKDYISASTASLKERIITLKELDEKSKFYYQLIQEYEPHAIEKNWTAETPKHLKSLQVEFKNIVANRRKTITNSLVEQFKSQSKLHNTKSSDEPRNYLHYKEIIRSNKKDRLIEYRLIIRFLKKVFGIKKLANDIPLSELILELSNTFQLNEIESAIHEYFTAYKIENEDYEKALTKVSDKFGIVKGKLIHPLRLAVSGQSVGPGLYDMLVVLGVDEVIRRINVAIEKIKT